MRPNGRVLMTMPAKYPHVCDHCGAENVFTNVSYPFISYRKMTPNY
jgi:hypothetical protein